MADREAHIQQAEKDFNVPKPNVYLDGDSWCALHGEDLQVGVAGFGDTPEEAVAEYEKNWELERG